MTPDQANEAIAANIRAERARARLGQEDLAGAMRRAGFSAWRYQTVGAIEHGRRRVTAAEVVGLCEILDIPVAALMGKP